MYNTFYTWDQVHYKYNIYYKIKVKYRKYGVDLLTNIITFCRFAKKCYTYK